MSYSITLTQRGIAYSKYRTATQNKSRRIVFSLLILLIILFSVLYIIQANSVATGGYKVIKYKNQLAELQAENKNLEIKLSEVRSLGFLEYRVESLNMNMIKMGRVEYLSPVSQVVAR